jgi:hypothetical protein
MNSIYRENVKAFILASEELLSPILSCDSMTKEECLIVRFYLESLTHHCDRLGHNEVERGGSSQEEVVGYPT